MQRFRTVEQLIIFIAVAGLFIAVVHRFIIPVTLGLLISLVLRPAYEWICRNTNNRTHLAASAATLLLILCVLVPLSVVAFFAARDTASVFSAWKEMADGDSTRELPFAAALHRQISKIHTIPREEFSRTLREWLAIAGDHGMAAVGTFAASVPRKAVSTIFFVVAFYFGLLDGPRLTRFLRSILPFSEADISTLFATVRRICRAVVLGALLAGTVQGTILGLGCWALGVPNPVLFGVMTVVFSFIPLVGSAPAGTIATLYLLFNGRIGAAMIMLVLFLIASLSDNVVKPWVLKGRGELHPLLGLLSVLGGLTVFGLPGLFLGPIVTALTVVLIPMLHRQMRPREVRPAVSAEAPDKT